MARLGTIFSLVVVTWTRDAGENGRTAGRAMAQITPKGVGLPSNRQQVIDAS